MYLDVMRDQHGRDIDSASRPGDTNLAVAHGFPRRGAHTSTGRANEYRRFRAELTGVVPTIEVFWRCRAPPKCLDETVRDHSRWKRMPSRQPANVEDIAARQLEAVLVRRHICEEHAAILTRRSLHAAELRSPRRVRSTRPYGARQERSHTSGSAERMASTAATSRARGAVTSTFRKSLRVTGCCGSVKQMKVSSSPY
jgi:hypothetical protein